MEAGTNQGLLGVNVVLADTLMGGVTDADGYYYILNIPPGTYNVQSSFVCFATVTTQNIRVVQNQTSILDFELREEAIVGGALDVVAERSIVEMDRTTTTAVIDTDTSSTLDKDDPD